MWHDVVGWLSWAVSRSLSCCITPHPSQDTMKKTRYKTFVGWDKDKLILKSNNCVQKEKKSKEKFIIYFPSAGNEHPWPKPSSAAHAEEDKLLNNKCLAPSFLLDFIDESVIWYRTSLGSPNQLSWLCTLPTSGPFPAYWPFWEGVGFGDSLDAAGTA